jgi:hypothetical protein
MLLCDDFRHDPSAPNKVDILGLVSTIQSHGDPPFPLHHPLLCVYLELTGGRGTGQANIAIRQADTGLVLSLTAPHAVTFPPDPLAIRGLGFRILDCVFPTPGLYWVQFCYNQNVLAEQSVLVR